MKKLINVLMLLMVIAVISSCKKDHAKPSDALVDPSDANALAQVVGMPAGTTRVSGVIPASTGGLQTPSINALISNVVTSNGATAPFLYTYTNAISNLGGFYVQVYGASTYFRVPYTGSQTTSGQINLPVALPANVDSGDFCLLFSVFDLSGRISNQVKVCADVLRLGTGALQVSLSWNTATDQDLHVKDPSGATINFGNKFSSTGGRLDRDDLDGFGPENIYWLSNAPDGEYKVQVDDYRPTSTTNTCYVTVSAPGKSKSFTVTTKNGSKVDVVTIKKSPNGYEF